MRYSRAYAVWSSMKDRCNNPKNKKYHRYGGRGITVCPRWINSFENFFADMGHPPSGMTLERTIKQPRIYARQLRLGYAYTTG